MGTPGSVDSAAKYAEALETADLLAFVADSSGELIFLTSAWERLTGRAAPFILASGFWPIVHVEDMAHARARWATAIATGSTYRDRFRICLDGGAYRWIRAEANMVARAGEQRVWIGVCGDIEDFRRASEARTRVALLADNSDDFIALGDADGTITFMNAAGRTMLSIGAADDIRSSNVIDYFAAADVPFVESVILPAMDCDGKWTGDFRLRDMVTGLAIPVALNVLALRDDSGQSVGIAAVGRDLRSRRRIDIGLRTLAETSAAMFESLDFNKTLQNVADAATRGFSTYCVIDIFGEQKAPEIVVTSHANPAFLEIVANMANTRDMDATHPVVRAATDGVSTLIPKVGDDWVTATGMRGAAEQWFERLMPGSIICVPMRSSQDGHIIGALSFGVDRRDQRGGFTEDDLRFAEEIALRAGIAADHSRAYAHERRIADALQFAALPKELPPLGQLRFSADYRPGSSEATIGGDWYDAFALDDGRVALVIGDVLGHGLAAAVIMGNVRRAMRAAATLIPTPSAMLDVADRTLRDESTGTFATAIAAIFDPVSHELRFAAAGHPCPVLRRADGSVEELIAYGLMLGIRGDVPGTVDVEHVISLPPSSTLVFYTDGLLEATRDVLEGQLRIVTAVSSDAVLAAGNPARAIIDHVLRERVATDDVAVLVVTS